MCVIGNRPATKTAGAALFKHGGSIAKASAHWNIPEARWLDLSTGINPDPWPVPEIPPTLWQRLPDLDSALMAAAKHYYQTEEIISVPGTQSVIQYLPTLRKGPANVLLPRICYNEHRFNWERANHHLFYFDNLGDPHLNLDELIEQHNIQVLVIVNPNNPLGTLLDNNQLLHYHAILQKRNGWLIVDEAFIDTKNSSLLSYGAKPGLIVLRSIGKFFGLAGARLGFAGGDPLLLQQLTDAIGPWAINHPTQYIGTLALQDKSWQIQAKNKLTHNASTLLHLLQQHIPSLWVQQIFNSDFFIPLLMESATAVDCFEKMARQGILIRHFPISEQQSLLRFGLLSASAPDATRRLIMAFRHAKSALQLNSQPWELTQAEIIS